MCAVIAAVDIGSTDSVPLGTTVGSVDVFARNASIACVRGKWRGAITEP